MEKKFKYTTRIKQPQTVAGIKLSPKGGLLTEREIKSIKKDMYGASLLEKNLLVIDEKPSSPSSETIPDFSKK